MLKRTLLFAALAISAALWLATGCTPAPPPVSPVPPSNPAAQPGTPIAGAAPNREIADTTPIRDAIATTLKRNASLFPKGTQLANVSVRDGVATLDFSPEFNHLANMGDTTESHAQKQLRAALAPFPEIEKMHVTVQGKPFDSQTTDWTEPFPVRDAADVGGQGAPGGAPTGTYGERQSGGG
jgi:hypothetical protein